MHGRAGVAPSLAFLSDGGEMGRLIRAHDWAATPLGPPETWPGPLRTVVGLMLGAAQPVYVAWGPELTSFYNDGYLPIVGAKHPGLGQPFAVLWAEIWDQFCPIVEATLAGEAQHFVDLPIALGGRPGVPVGYFTFSYTAIRDDHGGVMGLYVAATETTGRVAAEREMRESEDRLRFLDRLAHATQPLTDAAAVMAVTAQLLGEHLDVAVCAYADMEPDQDGFTIRGDWTAPGSASIVGVYSLASFGETAVRELRAGRPLVTRDTLAELGPEQAAMFLRLGLKATVCMPLVKEDRLTALMAVHAAHPRAWTHAELALVAETTERSWAHVERVRAEVSLRESEERYRQIVEGAEDFAIIVSDDRGVIASWNAGAERITGFPEAEAIGQPCAILFTPEDREAGQPDHEMNQARINGRAVDERWHLKRDGSRFWGSGLVMRLDQPGGGFLKIFRDRTAEHQAEAAVRVSEAALAQKAAEFEALAENVSQLAWMAEPNGHIYWYNKRWYDYTGTTLEQMQGWGWRDVHHPDHIDHVIAEVQANWARGEPWEGTYLLRGKDGEYRPFLTRAEPIRDEHGQLVRWFGTNTDITAQQEAEERLRELNDTLEQQVAERSAELDRTWRLSQDLFAIANTEGYLFRTNPAWSRVLGWSADEMTRTPFIEFVHPDDREATLAEFQKVLGGAPVLLFENRYRHKDGSYRWLSWSVTPEEGVFYAVARDVTGEKERAAELEAAQEALRQAQKMEAVGQLTGGLAHDFNNLLAGIAGSLELAGKRVAQGRVDEVGRYLDAAQEATKRAAALTHRLLAFSRRQTLDPKPTDANRLVLGMKELVRRTVGPGIDVETATADGLWATLVDPHQLENALLNLCINARDAMPDGGQLTIETANRHLDGRAARSRDLTSGHYVSVCVSDTGIGMPPQVAARAFDPFFTTKPLGQGTGLGLSMAYGFARQSGGQVRIHSEEGRGTTVCLYLPRHLGPAVEAEIDTSAGEAPRAKTGETVLVVDDEPTVRMLIREVLEELGYAALEAEDGASGLQVLRSDARIDLLVTDVGLPGGMNGRQMADAARLSRPDLQVLFITGYAEAAVVGYGHLDPGMHVVTKPFNLDALASRIGDLIEAK